MLSLLATLRRQNSRRPVTGLLASATLALAACGGGGDLAPPVAPTAVQTDGARTGRANLGSAGGTLSVTAADGRRYMSSPACL